MFNWSVPDEVALKRIETCKTCKHFQPKTTRCNKCGCFMKVKTQLKSLSCPIGRWDKYEEK